MDIINIDALYNSGAVATTIQPGDVFLLARPSVARGDNYLLMAIDQQDFIVQIAAGIPSGGGTLYIELTKAQLDTAITNSTLVAGTLYKITGVNSQTGNAYELYGGTDIFLTALTSNTLDSKGTGIFYNPKYDQTVVGFGVWSNFIYPTLSTIVGNFGYASKELVTANNGATGHILCDGMIAWVSGDWTSSTSITGQSSLATANITVGTNISYAINSTVIWGGKKWINTTGNVGSSTGLFTLSSDWTIIPYDTTNYNLVYDAIEYDYTNDLITYRLEISSNNWCRTAKSIIDDNFSNNPIRVIQWGNIFDENNYVGIYGINSDGGYFECINFIGNYISSITQGSGSYMSYITQGSGSNIQSITQGSNSHIQSITQGSNSHIQLIAQGSGSHIQSIIQGSNSYIQSITQGSGSNIQTNNLLLTFNINYINVLDGFNISNSVLNISSSTLLSGTYSKELYQRPDGALKLRYYNNSDALVIANYNA